MLQDVTLFNLADGRVEQKFQAALQEAMDAWAEGRDGKAVITIQLHLMPKEGSPFVDMVAKTKVAMPDRSTGSVLALKDGRLKVETTTDDAQQPGMFEKEETGNVVPMKRSKA